MISYPNAILVIIALNSAIGLVFCLLGGEISEILLPESGRGMIIKILSTTLNVLALYLIFRLNVRAGKKFFLATGSVALLLGGVVSQALGIYILGLSIMLYNLILFNEEARQYRNSNRFKAIKIDNQNRFVLATVLVAIIYYFEAPLLWGFVVLEVAGLLIQSNILKRRGY